MPPPLFLAIAAIIAATTVHAIVDFHGISHPATRVDRPDGMVEWRHDVHHVFPESATFFKAKYHAVHHKRWHFVKLHEHADFMRDVDCGASDEELFVRRPTAAFAAALAQQDYQHTVLVAHQQYHCGNVGIFRRVNNVSVDTTTGTLRIDTTQLAYQHVFETLHFVLDTNHLPTTIEHAPQRDAHELDQIARAKREAAHIARVKANPAAYRGMNQQSWWSKLKSAVTKAVAVAATVVKATVAAVNTAVNLVKTIVTGKYEFTKDFNLVTMNYNKDVSKGFERWNIVGSAKLACSVNAAAGVHFGLLINSYKVDLAEAYLFGNFQAGVIGQFSAGISKDMEGETEVAKMALSTITFAIGPIPVVINPTIPLSIGYSLNIEGGFYLTMLLQASGSIKQGLRYTSSTGLTVVNEKSFDFVKDFTPREFKYSVGVTAYVMAQLDLDINFIGGPYAGVKISGEALIENNPACFLLLTINIQPIIVAGAALDISIGSISIMDEEWGPTALVSTKIPLFRLCLPKITIKAKNHYYLTQGADGEGNAAPVVTTVATSLSSNYTGTVWHGTSNCANNGSKPLSFSVQFTTGDEENSTVLILTIARNVSTANGTYAQSNLQRSYQFLDEIKAGMYAQLQLMTGATQIDEQDVTGNSSAAVDPVINSTIWFAVNPTDTRLISIDSPMVCGNVSMQSQTMTNDNSTFVIFAAGLPQPASFLDQVKTYIVYAPILGAAVLIAIIAGVVLSRQRAQRRAAAVNFVAPSEMGSIRTAPEADEKRFSML